MYSSLRLRFADSLHDLCNEVEDIIIIPELVRGMAHHGRASTAFDHYRSTASAPSMRSRTPVEIVERPFTPPDADGGNVKVVVRVRKFVRRGRWHARFRYGRAALTCGRAREAVAMSDRNEPAHECDDTASAHTEARGAQGQQEAAGGEELMLLVEKQMNKEQIAYRRV